MRQRNNIANLIKWIARISGTAIVVFVLYFLLMYLLGSESESIISTKDVFAFFCFPVSTIIGLSIAWKWEAVGGLISTLGFILLFVVRPDLSSSPIMTALALPGLLYLVYWILRKKSKKIG